MDGLTWIIASIVVLGVIVGLSLILLIIRRDRLSEESRPVYLTFFIMGVTYLALGISLSFVYPMDTDILNFFTFMGIIFTAYSLINYKKWRKKPD